MQLDSTGRLILGTLAYAGTRFDQITSLQYRTYRASFDIGDNLAISLQFDVDYDLTDTDVSWQGRLVYEPYLTPGIGGTVIQNTWQTWNPLTGRWWASGAPGNTLCPQSSPCTWTDVLTNWPNAGLRAAIGALLFKAGGPWPSFDGNVDAFTIGVAGDNTTFDFEPETPCTTTCYVDAVNGNDAFGGDTPASAKKTIQAAVTQVSPGGTVIVATGTYPEQVTINKSLTLTGAGAATTTIKAPATLAVDLFGPAIVTLGNGAVVTMSGFTVAGPKDPPLTCDPTQALDYGIKVQGNATLNLSNSTITAIRDNPLSGCQTGIGIGIGRSAFSQVGSATITNVTINDYQKGGIVVSNAGSSATITGNTITGVGNTPAIAQNGVQISGGAVATVTNNIITGHRCDNPSCGPDPITQTFSAGVIIFEGGNGIRVENNTISNNDVGVYNYVGVGATTVISANTIANNRFEGVFLDEGNATVSHNDITGTTNVGVAAVAFDVAVNDSTGILTNNRIQVTGTAIRLYDENASDGEEPIITATLNSLASAGGGIVYSGPATLSAVQNWWGDITGPSGAGSGTGASVSPNVTFNPWLCSGADTSSAVGFQPDSANLGPCIDLSIAKSGAPNPVQVNAPLTYVLTVTNNGFQASGAFTVTDALPAGMTASSVASNGGGSCSGSATITCTFSTLANGASAQITITADAPATGGSIVNTANVTLTKDLTPTNNTATATTLVLGPGIVMSKTVGTNPLMCAASNSLIVAAGVPVTYCYTVQNTGNVTFTSHTLTDSALGSILNDFAFNLAPGASTFVTQTTTLVTTTTNLATWTATDGVYTVTASSAATVTVVPSGSLSDVAITKTGAPDPVLTRSKLTYTLVVSNAGPNAATNVVVTDSLPAGVTAVTAASSQGSCTISGATVTCNLGSLGVGSSATVTITLTTPATAGPLTNTATVSADNDVSPGNNTATITTTVRYGVYMPIIQRDAQP